MKYDTEVWSASVFFVNKSSYVHSTLTRPRFYLILHAQPILKYISIVQRNSNTIYLHFFVFLIYSKGVIGNVPAYFYKILLRYRSFCLTFSMRPLYIFSRPTSSNIDEMKRASWSSGKWFCISLFQNCEDITLLAFILPLQELCM